MGRTLYEHNCELVDEDSIDGRGTPKHPDYPVVQIQPGAATPDATLEPEDARSASSTEADTWQSVFLQACRKHLHLVEPYVQPWLPNWATDPKQHSSLDHSPPPFAWHHDYEVLAASDGASQVFVYGLAQAARARSSAGPTSSADALPPALTLAHAQQQEVGSLAWRPRSRNMLAVGCTQGVCLWTLPIQDGTARPLGSSGATMTLLRCGSTPVTALAWCPTGRLLATASVHGPGLLIWQVATAEAQRLQADLAATSLLTWSPDGAYLFATSAASSSFRLWSTLHWASASFQGSVTGRSSGAVAAAAEGASSHGDTGRVTAACWSKKGKMALLGFQGSSVLTALYLTSKAPSLDCQLLPVRFPGIADDAVKGVAALAWDQHDARLAVAVHSGGVPQTKLAIFATDDHPLLALRLIGWPQEARARAPPSGDKDSELPTAPVMGFQPAFKDGSLLAVRSDAERIVTLPLLYHAWGR